MVSKRHGAGILLLKYSGTISKFSVVIIQALLQPEAYTSADYREAYRTRNPSSGPQQRHCPLHILDGGLIGYVSKKLLGGLKQLPKIL